MPVNLLPTWNLAATACDDACGIFLYFSTQIGLSVVTVAVAAILAHLKR
jgi:hypothetical protein